MKYSKGAYDLRSKLLFFANAAKSKEIYDKMNTNNIYKHYVTKRAFKVAASAFLGRLLLTAVVVSIAFNASMQSSSLI